jgi:DNA-binding SARP family transcriptional activator/DNA-binding beta-propeller fold protein YncE
VDFRILGPLEVTDGEPLTLGGAQQRALLALFVTHAGESLATERLVDELWGERQPPTAVKTVQVYVSQLRKLLGPDRVERNGRGYRLVAAADEVDARRFEERATEGRAALDAGELEGAAAALADADALWRGRALGEIDLPWAVVEAARLEELRVAAQEDRLDAELALGRHAALTAELEALCRAHPLRERLVGQRMLALYRCGRQAEALDAYRQARAQLVGELGIEPGAELRELERRMLVQDPELAAPRRVLPPARRRRRRVLATAAALAAIATVTVAALAAGGGDLPPPGPNTAVAVDPDALEFVHRVRVGDAPAAIAVAAGGAWVVNANDETVSFVDAERAEVARTVVTRGTPLDVVAGRNAVWVVNRPPALVRVDPQTAQADRRVPLPRPARSAPPHHSQGWSAATVDDEVWVTDGRWLWRVRPADRHPVRRAGAPLPGPLAAATSVWVGGVAQVDRTTLRARRRFGIGHAADVAVGAGAVWIADPSMRRIVRVDPRSGRITRAEQVGAEPTGVAVGEGAVWASLRTGELLRLDQRTGAVTGRVAVGGSPRSVAAGDGLVWVAAG